MELNLVLSKESSANEIRQYFSTILELLKAENDFPVNLDNVWPLVYSEKSKAVRILQKNFIQHVDYQFLAQKGEKSNKWYELYRESLSNMLIIKFYAKMRKT